VLRVAVDILADVILVAAGLILLPDFWVSVNCRSSGRCPPKLVYEFGSLVAAIASHSRRFLRRLCLGQLGDHAKQEELSLETPISGQSMIALSFRSMRSSQLSVGGEPRTMRRLLVCHPLLGTSHGPRAQVVQPRSHGSRPWKGHL
jgi:hypothetical protein